MKSDSYTVFKGVGTRKSYSYWSEILEQWTTLVEQAYRITGPQDAVYSFKEQTNVGLLATAATMRGWVALTECRSHKKASAEGHASYSGQLDLGLWRDKEPRKELEAKFLRWDLKMASQKRIDWVAAGAHKDAAKGVGSGEKIALTFVVPTTQKKLLETLGFDEIRDLQLKLIGKIIANQKPVFIAYTFPGQADIAGQERKALGVIVFGADPYETKAEANLPSAKVHGLVDFA